MPNTSATGGALSPTGFPAVLEGQALVDFLQEWAVGIVGMPGSAVRPRWQPEPPNIPDGNWAAFGIQRREKDTFAYVGHSSAGQGSDELRRHEVLHCLVSFYGPDAELNAELLSDGMQVPQNLEKLTGASMGLVSCGDPVLAPELVKETWLQRVDLPFAIKRQVVRNYAVLNILSAGVVLTSQNAAQNVTTEQIRTNS